MVGECTQFMKKWQTRVKSISPHPGSRCHPRGSRGVSYIYIFLDDGYFPTNAALSAYIFLLTIVIFPLPQHDLQCPLNFVAVYIHLLIVMLCLSKHRWDIHRYRYCPPTHSTQFPLTSPHNNHKSFLRSPHLKLIHLLSTAILVSGKLRVHRRVTVDVSVLPLSLSLSLLSFFFFSSSPFCSSFFCVVLETVTLKCQVCV